MKKYLFTVALLVLVLPGFLSARTAAPKKRPLPFEYGRVRLNNFSEASGRLPVVFDHWLHRAKYTCRLCHMDIGFAMKAGATGITAADNQGGFYCGTCHNGGIAFSACSQDAVSGNSANCDRCHSEGMSGARKIDFREFTRDFPRGRFGNGIDWEQAEAGGKIKLIDSIEGLSMKSTLVFNKQDFEVGAKREGIPGIIFSHDKHTVWNGCEVCHPDIFEVTIGATRYSMVDIYQGKYCGVCHGRVAFPVIDCQRCHLNKVQ
jgi:c(7)-type cytochrome triheme protein